MTQLLYSGAWNVDVWLSSFPCRSRTVTWTRTGIALRSNQQIVSMNLDSNKDLGMEP